MAMSRIGKIAEFTGFTMMMGGYITTLVTFLYAYNNNMRAVIYINMFNEAIPELIGLLFTFPLVFYTLFKWTFRFVVEKEE